MALRIATLKRILFLCSRARLRSPTAAQVFSTWPGLETACAGLAPDADEPVTPEHLAWAQIIFVMEQLHQTQLVRRFRPYLRHVRVICLNIPDDYGYMDPALITRLEKRVTPHLARKTKS